MAKSIDELLRIAKTLPMSSEDKERQRRSFAYGNTNIENSNITREIIDRQADILLREEEK